MAPSARFTKSCSCTRDTKYFPALSQWNPLAVGDANILIRSVYPI